MGTPQRARGHRQRTFEDPGLPRRELCLRRVVGQKPARPGPPGLPGPLWASSPSAPAAGPHLLGEPWDRVPGPRLQLAAPRALAAPCSPPRGRADPADARQRLIFFLTLPVGKLRPEERKELPRSPGEVSQPSPSPQYLDFSTFLKPTSFPMRKLQSLFES